MIAACVLIAALLLAAVERTGNSQSTHRGVDPGVAASTVESSAIESPAIESAAMESSAMEFSATGSLTLDAPPALDPSARDLSLSPTAAAAAVPASSGTNGLPTAAGTTNGPSIDAALAPELEVIGRAALSRIGYPWQWLGYDITFAPGRDGLHALTFPYEQRIEIYVRDDDSVAGLAHVIAHEIGHAIDVELSDGDQRRAWLRSRGLPEDYPWWPGNGLNDFAVGAGDFAECFANWDLGAPSLSQLPGDCEDSADVLESIINS